MIQDIHRKLNPGLSWQKQLSRSLFTSKLDRNLRKKLVKCHVWNRASYGAETSTFQKVNQKYVESFKMWRWRWMEKISWTDHMRNEEMLQRVEGERNILPAIKRRKANLIGHILLTNYRLKLVFEGKLYGMIEVTGRRERRCR
jgi:hypothetical protein